METMRRDILTALTEQRLFVLFLCSILHVFFIGASDSGNLNTNPYPLIGICIAILFILTLLVLEIGYFEFRTKKFIWSNEPIIYAFCTITSLISFILWLVLFFQRGGNEYLISDILSPSVLISLSLLLIVNKDFKADRWLNVKYFYDDIQSSSDPELCGFYLDVDENGELLTKLSEKFSTDRQYSITNQLDYTNLPILKKESESTFFEKFSPIEASDFESLGSNYIISNQIMQQISENSKCMLMLCTLFSDFDNRRQFSLGDNTNKEKILQLEGGIQISFCWSYQEILNSSRIIIKSIFSKNAGELESIDYSKYLKIKFQSMSKLDTMLLLGHLYLLSSAKLHGMNQAYWRALNRTFSESARFISNSVEYKQFQEIFSVVNDYSHLDNIRGFFGKIDAILLDPVDNFVFVYDRVCDFLHESESKKNSLSEEEKRVYDGANSVVENVLAEMTKSIKFSKQILDNSRNDPLEVRKNIIAANAVILSCLIGGGGIYED